MMRRLQLGRRLARASPWRLALMIALVTVAFVVRSVVAELSEISAEGLDDAITAEAGVEGTYRIGLDSDLGLGRVELTRLVGEAVAEFAPSRLTVSEVYPPVSIDCPPLEALGAQQLLIVTDHLGPAREVPYGRGLDGDTSLCIGGLSIPLDDAYLPTIDESGLWGLGIVVRPEYRDVARLSGTAPVAYGFAVETGDPALADPLAATVAAALQPIADRQGFGRVDVFAQRVDSADELRRAGAGIRTIYRIIGWGIVALAGLGLLVTELIIVRDRLWFFGLLRALGASSRHVITLVLAEIALVLIAGNLLAIGLTAALEPAAARFTIEAFDTPSNLLRPSTVTSNLLAGVVVLAIAGLVPALRAIRHDPLTVLEPASGG